MVVCCVWCASVIELGPEGGAAVAEAMTSCKQLTSVNLAGVYCVLCLCCVLRCVRLVSVCWSSCGLLPLCLVAVVCGDTMLVCGVVVVVCAVCGVHQGTSWGLRVAQLWRRR